ncbi:MAG TPA: hypothetical protein VMD47_01935 [Candidatus Acidoferrales bacterium]|nr:hypothetical protein [Candidatus Acidoferrales bacterium]
MRALRLASLVIACAGVVLTSCSGKGGNGGPAGWSKVDATTWVQGSGAAQERYVSTSTAFSGSLKDLASQETINVILRYPGAHFVSSVPLAACPGEAGLATFRSRKATIESAFSVQNDRALTILYERPAGAKPSDAVTSALGAALCNV